MNLLDIEFYRNFHMDLKSLNWSDNELIEQYKTYGSSEGRMCSETNFYNLYPIFDVDFYNSNNSDLSILNGDKYLLMWHYHNYGFQEGRIGTNFDPIFYQNFHLDIKSLHLDETQLYDSYQKYGKKEGRLCCEDEFYKLYPNFDLESYKKNNTDLNIFNGDNYILMWHYCNHGFPEGRNCSKQVFPFEQINEITKNNDPKEEYRNICLQNLNYIKYIDLPEFQEKSFYEAVLIEYRCFPHLEFLIRNAIIKLGEKWSHTLICGNLNYEYMIELCDRISNKIKVIKTNYNNLFPSDYSSFLASMNFWNLINGEKIIIYQEDTFIFKNNIDDFLNWDFIGAPWPVYQNDNIKGVGNGGFSLRTKSIMEKIINTISIGNTKFNSSTLNYIEKTNSYIPPEDVYFTKNMENFNIGLLADRNSALQFSTESIFNKDSLGGHQFWLNDPKWKNRLIENIYELKTNCITKPISNKIQFNSHYDISFLEHRGGWKSILIDLIKKNFFNKQSINHFYDIIEANFLWGNENKQKDRWAGIIHCTPTTPNYLKNLNLNTLFDKPIFKESLVNCRFLVTLSSYISKFLNKKLTELNMNIPVFTLKHPVEIDSIPLFCFEKYLSNNNKKLIQIGQQLRKVTSIYQIDSNKHEKWWLTGTKNFNFCNDLLKKEYLSQKLNKNNFDKNVKMYYTETFEEYDELLTENIVFVDLYDAAANNTILECIVRNTPIIVNKIEPIIEYLGEDYPFYFNCLEEIPFLLKDQDKILKAHEYLCKMEKNDLSIDYFTRNLIDICNKYFC